MEYEPLSHRQAEIRLLTLHRDKRDAVVRCTIWHASLYKTPSYHALSYCWGDLGIRIRVLVNGFDMEVTFNLKATLRQLRADGYTTLWVDALCINQEDLEERKL
jgi:hypothetical protein